MQYQITFDSITRQMTYNGILNATQGDVDPDLIFVVFNDSGGLLEGYTPYCVFGKGIRKEVVNGSIEIPKGLPAGMTRIQLCFEKEDSKFYSLNTARLRLNKVIR